MKFRKGTDEKSRVPEKVEEALQRVVNAYIASGGNLPDFMPQSPIDAAQWWIDHQQTYEEPWETPRQISVVGREEAQRWESPYVNRLRGTLRLFLGLPYQQQRYILAAWEDGVWWRGENLDWHFPLLIEEVGRMNPMGKDAYIAEAKDKRRQFIEQFGG
ncbi:MAG: hypothetical protein MN733_18120 [Nitrososphaera sp.]|nr:hypothetical protein [Nitrososphaera sp.]